MLVFFSENLELSFYVFSRNRVDLYRIDSTERHQQSSLSTAYPSPPRARLRPTWSSELLSDLFFLPFFGAFFFSFFFCALYFILHCAFFLFIYFFYAVVARSQRGAFFSAPYTVVPVAVETTRSYYIFSPLPKRADTIQYDTKYFEVHLSALSMFFYVFRSAEPPPRPPIPALALTTLPPTAPPTAPGKY